MKPVDTVTPTLPGNSLRRVEDRRKPGEQPRREGGRRPQGTPAEEPPDRPGATAERRHIIDELA